MLVLFLLGQLTRCKQAMLVVFLFNSWFCTWPVRIEQDATCVRPLQSGPYIYMGTSPMCNCNDSKYVDTSRCVLEVQLQCINMWTHSHVYSKCNRSVYIYMDTSQCVLGMQLQRWYIHGYILMCTLECNCSVYIWIHANVYPECNCSASIYMGTCRFCTLECNCSVYIYGYMPMCTRIAIAALVYIWTHADVYPECNCSASIYMDTCRCVSWNAIAALLYICICPNVYPGMQLQHCMYYSLGASRQQ